MSLTDSISPFERLESVQDELTEALKEEYVPEFDFGEAVEVEYPEEELKEFESLADELPEHHKEEATEEDDMDFLYDSQFNKDTEERGMELGLRMFSDLFEQVDWASTAVEGITGAAGMLIGIKLAPIVSTALGRPVSDPANDMKQFGWLRVTAAGIVVFGLGAVAGEYTNEWIGLFITFMGAGLVADGLTKGALHRALAK